MMKAANFRERDHVSFRRRLHASRRRRVLLQGEMCAGPMIIGDIRRQEPSQMPFAEDDHMVQTLAANGSDQPFREWILPRAQRAREYLANAHASDTPPEHLTVDGVAIPQQPSRRGVVRKRFNHLLRRPGRRRMFRDTEMDDSATL